MDLIYIGRYCKDEILKGPEKVAKRIFNNYTVNHKSLFIEYYFDGKKYGILKKLFGKETVETINGSDVCRMGIFSLFFALFKLKPKIIHLITFERFAFAAYFYKMFFKTKIIYSLHGLIVHENKFFRKVNRFFNLKDKIAERIFVKYSNALILLSGNFGKLLENYYTVNDSRIRYIKNGIDPEFAEAGKLRKPCKNNQLKIVYIADTDRKEKGFSFLKDALETINIDIELYIIDKSEPVQNELFINKRIKTFYAGKMKPDELAGYLTDKDVFISSGSYEPFSITTVECMAAGVIPVVTKETGASESIEQGRNGFVFDYGDCGKLKSILIELNNDNELKENVSARAKYIYNILNWDKITGDYINIYKSLQQK
jgi:glycosyltransferase involved in cell wall biosynthesis